MVDPVTRLGAADEPSLERLLGTAPLVNLFLRGFLAAHPVGSAWWYGVGAPLRAVVMVVPARLAVPFAPDPADAARLGAHLRGNFSPSLVVGPRAATDALWVQWSGATPRRRNDQRLFVCSEVAPLPAPEGFRRATAADAERIALQAARMELEELGRDPLREDPVHHGRVVRERIRDGRTYVVVREGDGIVFQVNVGTMHPDGCQLGGTYVPPAHRGRGLGARGIAATCRALGARVTLHVDEANHPAVAAYQRAGFVPDAAFRLLLP